MKVCFIASGPIEWASARYRAYWVAPYMEDATVVELPYEGDKLMLPYADVYIWQKRFDKGISEFISENGWRQWWDVCDPLWWLSPELSKDILDRVEGVVSSTQALADDFTAWSGRDCHVIPDRLELSHYNKQREHRDVQPVRFIWYGMGVNRPSLAGAWINLHRLVANGHDISLTVMDDMPGTPLGFGDEVPIYYVPWKLEHEVEVIAQHDIALLPPYPGPWGPLKSNNKSKSAWACGLPYSKGYNYEAMERLVKDCKHRMNFAALEGMDVRHSAAEWEALLNV